jgi:hypothetical protein
VCRWAAPLDSKRSTSAAAGGRVDAQQQGIIDSSHCARVLCLAGWGISGDHRSASPLVTTCQLSPSTQTSPLLSSRRTTRSAKGAIKSVICWAG